METGRCRKALNRDSGGLGADPRTPGAGGLSPWIWAADGLLRGRHCQGLGRGSGGQRLQPRGGWGGSFGGALPGARLGSPPPPPGPQAPALRQGQQWSCPGPTLHATTSRGWGERQGQSESAKEPSVSHQRDGSGPFPRSEGPSSPADEARSQGLSRWLQGAALPPHTLMSHPDRDACVVLVPPPWTPSWTGTHL